MDFDKVLWGSKKFSDLLKDIYTNSKEKEKQIKDLIETLKPLVTDTQSALMIVPLIAEHLNISVKNDEALIKMAGIVQRAMSAGPGEGGDGGILSDRDKELLFQEISGIKIEEPKQLGNGS